jgi:hypothetical protein
MERARHYHALAAQCVLMAEEVNDPAHRAALLEMAQRWRDLADQVEQADLRDDD